MPNSSETTTEKYIFCVISLKSNKMDKIYAVLPIPAEYMLEAANTLEKAAVQKKQVSCRLEHSFDVENMATWWMQKANRERFAKEEAKILRVERQELRRLRKANTPLE